MDVVPIYRIPGITLYDPLKLLLPEQVAYAMEQAYSAAYNDRQLLFGIGETEGALILINLSRPYDLDDPVEEYLRSQKVVTISRLITPIGGGGSLNYALRASFATAGSLRRAGLLQGAITEEWARALKALSLLCARSTEEEDELSRS